MPSAPARTYRIAETVSSAGSYNQPHGPRMGKQVRRGTTGRGSGKKQTRKPRLTPEAAARLREKESLRLSLQNVIHQIEQSHNARHRAMLEQARSDLEQRLQDLGA